MKKKKEKKKKKKKKKKYIFANYITQNSAIKVPTDLVCPEETLYS